jgi:tRNA1(Val) A37 N6-methylase TrmN6
MFQDQTPPEITEDLILGGRIRLCQPRHGYRAGLDAALLAASVVVQSGERGVEAGCGPGAALLQVAQRNPDAQLVGIEKAADALDLALENLALNDLAGRVSALRGDVEQPFSRLGLPHFDAAFANPPFFDDASTLRGPAPSRRAAYLTDAGLQAWTGFLLKAVRQGGRITVIHRADRLADLLALLGKGAGSIRIRPIQPFADQPAKRVLVQATKTGKAPLVLLAPLVLHDRSGGKHTSEADAILRGEASLAWS